MKTRPTPGTTGGGSLQRDGAYHQGTVWGWILGPFVAAHYRVYGDVTLAQSFLSGLEYHLSDACLGSISEIFDGDPPPHGARMFRSGLERVGGAAGLERVT